MFDETNENQNVTEGQNITEGQNAAEEQNVTDKQVITEAQTTVNPYIAGEMPQSVPVSPIPEEPVKKSSNKVVIGVIAGIAALLLIIVLVLIFGGLFKNDKQMIMDALKATFTESGNYMKEAWGIEQYEGMFEEDIYTVDAQMDLPEGIGVGMTIQNNADAYGIYADGSMYGSSLVDIQIYMDDAEIVAALPGMVDYVFTINRATLADDIQNMVDMDMIDQQSADEIIALNEGSEEEAISEEAYEQFEKDVMQACAAFFDKCEVEKGKSKELPVNGEDVNCKGYVLVITGENMAQFAEDIKAAYQNNEECVNAAFGVYESADIELPYDLDELYDSLDELAEECRDSEENAEIEFYLYDGKVAQIYVEFDEGEYMAWNIEGGNFPLENTSIVMEDTSGVLFEIKRTGSDGNRYRAKYEISDGYETYVFEIKYSKENGDFAIDLSDDVYDYSILSMEGRFEKVSDSAIEISIDSLEIEEETVLSGDITIENTCDTIERPEGVEKEFLLLSEDELEAIMWEIVMSMY